MNDKTKKIFISIFAVLLLCSICFFTGKYSAKRVNNDLSKQLEQTQCRAEELEGQLCQRIYELEQIQSEIDSIRGGIDESIGITQQAGQLIGDIGSTVSNLGSTSGDIGETIRQIQRNNKLIGESVKKLQNTNRKLEAKLRQL